MSSGTKALICKTDHSFVVHSNTIFMLPHTSLCTITARLMRRTHPAIVAFFHLPREPFGYTRKGLWNCAGTRSGDLFHGLESNQHHLPKRHMTRFTRPLAVELQDVQCCQTIHSRRWERVDLGHRRNENEGDQDNAHNIFSKILEMLRPEGG